jgi:formate dehydrogenase maturation protein FdhE
MTASTASASEIRINETAAAVIFCPSCGSSTVGMLTPQVSSLADGSTRRAITTIPLHCGSCTAEWEIELVASSHKDGSPIDLAASVTKAV